MLEFILTTGQRAMAAARRIGLNEPNIPELAKAAGVAKSSISDARAVLTRGTPEEIAAVENGTATLTRVAKLVRQRPKVQLPLHAGNAVRVNGSDSLCAIVRTGIPLQERGVTPLEVAKRLGISVRAFGIVRDMLLLSERDDLLETEMATVTTALAEVEQTHRLFQPWERVKPIAQRIWGEKGARMKRRRSSPRHAQKFKEAISYVLSTCESAAEIDIPIIGEAEADAACRNVSRAVDALRKLKWRIRESQT